MFSVLYKILHYLVQCITDIRIEAAAFWPDSVKYLYQDVNVELAFNVSVHLIGQQLPGASPPHLSFEFVLSDEADVVASGSFNGGGGAVVVGDQSAVVFEEEILEGKFNVASPFFCQKILLFFIHCSFGNCGQNTSSNAFLFRIGDRNSGRHNSFVKGNNNSEHSSIGVQFTVNVQVRLLVVSLKLEILCWG